MTTSFKNHTTHKDVLYTTSFAGVSAMLEETLILLDFVANDADRLQLNSEALFDAVRATGLFPRHAESRVKRIVSTFWQRYSEVLPELAALLGKIGGDLTRLLFLHTARTEPIFCDFMVEVYWPAYRRGASELTLNDAVEFIHEAHFQQRVRTHWAESTINRVASSLINACIEFGFLYQRQGEKGAGAFNLAQSHVGLASGMFAAYSLRSLGLGDNAIVSHRLWRAFGLEASDVHELFKKLTLNGWMIFQSAGHLVSISWLLDGREARVQAALDYYEADEFQALSDCFW